eukprot:m.104902 g.104902  ORF g.104902 m.104902 type:complete len:523 (-) comp27602_c1_seq1:111-1679(-)
MSLVNRMRTLLDEHTRQIPDNAAEDDADSDDQGLAESEPAPLTALPLEILTLMICFLTVGDVVNLGSTCRLMRELISEERCWARLVAENGGTGFTFISQVEIEVLNARGEKHGYYNVFRKSLRSKMRRYRGVDEHPPSVLRKICAGVTLFRVAQVTKAAEWVCAKCIHVNRPQVRTCKHCSQDAPIQVQIDLRANYLIAALGQSPDWTITIMRSCWDDANNGCTSPLQQIARPPATKEQPSPVPHRIGVQYPLIGVGYKTGQVIVYDMRTGARCDSLGPENVEAVGGDVCAWMVMWGKPGQLFVLHGASTVTEWQRDLSLQSTQVTFEKKKIIDLHPIDPDVHPQLRLSDDVYFMDSTGDRLVSSHASGSVRVHNVISGICTHDEKIHTDVACRIDVANDMIVTCSFDGHLKCFRIDVADFVLVNLIDCGRPIGGMSRSLSQVAIFTFNTVTGRGDSLQVWDLDETERIFCEVFDDTSEDDEFNNYALSFDGRRIIFISDFHVDPLTEVEHGGSLQALEFEY